MGHLHVSQPPAVVSRGGGRERRRFGTFNGLRDTALRWRADLGQRWPEVAAARTLSGLSG